MHIFTVYRWQELFSEFTGDPAAVKPSKARSK